MTQATKEYLLLFSHISAAIVQFIRTIARKAEAYQLCGIGYSVNYPRKLN